MAQPSGVRQEDTNGSANPRRKGAEQDGSGHSHTCTLADTNVTVQAPAACRFLRKKKRPHRTENGEDGVLRRTPKCPPKEPPADGRAACVGNLGWRDRPEQVGRRGEQGQND